MRVAVSFAIGLCLGAVTALAGAAGLAPVTGWDGAAVVDLAARRRPHGTPRPARGSREGFATTINLIAGLTK